MYYYSGRKYVLDPMISMVNADFRRGKVVLTVLLIVNTDIWLVRKRIC